MTWRAFTPALLALACSNPSEPADATEPQALGSSACGSEPVGREQGAFIEDFTLRDATNAEVQLSDHCGEVVLLVFGAMWCPGCRDEALRLEEDYQRLRDRGFFGMTLLGENDAEKPPTPEDLQVWAQTYGASTPVLADTDWKVLSRYWPPRTTPKKLLVGRDGKIRMLGFALNRDLEAALAE